MRTLGITGIGGFIGLRLAGRARAGGLRVVGLERSEAAAAQARRLGCRVHVGDVADPAPPCLRHRARPSGARLRSPGFAGRGDVARTERWMRQEGLLPRRLRAEGTPARSGPGSDAAWRSLGTAATRLRDRLEQRLRRA